MTSPHPPELPLFDPDYCRALLEIQKPHLLVAAIQQHALAWQVGYGLGSPRACGEAYFWLYCLLDRLSDFNRAIQPQEANNVAP